MSSLKSSIPSKMKAVVFHGPYDIRTVERPVPKVESSKDVILKVHYSGLCGTDLHSYRDHINGPVGTTVGHEFVGVVVAKGSDVKDKDFKAGDEVVSTFTIQCGECWYCENGYSGQCDITNTFGKPGLDGGQAEYVRVPYATSTLIKLPKSNDDVENSVYVLMADIFITGYYGVKKIVDFLKREHLNSTKNFDPAEVTILQLGLGPVGLCAVRVLKQLGFKKIVCVDNVDSRLKAASDFGASEVINFSKSKDWIGDVVRDFTSGLGFDAVLEVVGSNAALKTAYDSVRRNGFISSIGMAHGDLPFNGLECYVKNINISFGRCHAMSLFPEALAIFELVKRDFESFIDYKTDLDHAGQAFKLFDEHKVNKVVFDLT